MRSAFLVFTALIGINSCLLAQNYQPLIEPRACQVKLEKNVIAKCGYLVVPENRQKPAGNKVKIPFMYVRKAGTDSTKNVTLYTTGGPGYSSIPQFDSMRASSGFLQFGGFIWFNQRGTKNSEPCLECPEVTEANKVAYLKNLSKDGTRLEAIKRCRQRLTDQGIDLSSYTTIESAADISDLRRALKLDSLTLFGISYSGGLMLTVVRNHPEAAKQLILNCPLPGFVNYEEHALVNHQEALNLIFRNCEADSGHDSRYKDLQKKFETYFQGITGKKFRIAYAREGLSSTVDIEYTKQELMDAIIDRINTEQLKEVPFVITEIMKGNHALYVKEILDAVFAGKSTLAHGMRYSVYCSEQVVFSDKQLIKQQELLFPWFAGYAFNNVDHPICDCWDVKPEPMVAKTPVYSKIPALIATGDADPWCRPFYNTLIKRTIPNSQLLIVKDNGHGARLGMKGIDFVKMFMENPYRRIESPLSEVRVE